MAAFNSYSIITMVALIFLIGIPVTPVFADLNNASDNFPKGDPTKDDDGLVSDVHKIENKMKEMMEKGSDIFHMNVSYFPANLTVSPSWVASILRVFGGVLDIEDWAMKMADATGKFPSGILEGTMAALGDYDECLDIGSKDHRFPNLSIDGEEILQGQYCMLKLSLPEPLKKDYQRESRIEPFLIDTNNTMMKNITKIAPRADGPLAFRLGVCVPSKCNRDDLQVLFRTAVQMANFEMSVIRCEKKGKTKMGLDQLVTVAILGCILFLILGGTVIDLLLCFAANEPKGAHMQLLISFSLNANIKKLTSLETDDGSPSCIRGIKYLSVCLSVVASMYDMSSDFHFYKYRNDYNCFKFMDDWWFTIISNASVNVDTLFFIAGLQITYGIWKNRPGSDMGTARINIPRFLIIWCGRLTASQLMVVGLFLLLPLIGSGPLWGDLVTPEINRCRNTWWMNVLHINNFWPSDKTCLYHTWFVSSLMQMLVLTSFLLYILNRWTSVGTLLILALALGSTVAIAVVTILKELSAAPALCSLGFLNGRSVWDTLFIQAYNHLGPFCVGILLGRALAQRPKFTLKKMTVITGWVVVAISNTAILVGLYFCRHQPMTVTFSAFYASFHRIAWSAGIGWITFACAYGYGGAIDDVLSCKMFIPLGRLSNFIYLLQPLVILYHGGQIRERLYMSNLDQAMYAAAYVVFTCILAAACYLVFYFPFTCAQSLLLKEREETKVQSHTKMVTRVTAIKGHLPKLVKLRANRNDQVIIPETNIGGVVNDSFWPSALGNDIV